MSSFVEAINFLDRQQLVAVAWAFGYVKGGRLRQFAALSPRAKGIARINARVPARGPHGAANGTPAPHPPTHNAPHAPPTGGALQHALTPHPRCAIPHRRGNQRPPPPPHERRHMPTTTRTPVATPKVAKDLLATIDPALDAAIAALVKASGPVKGSDLTRAMIDTGHLPNVGTRTKTPVAAQGLALRTYMRSHGAWAAGGAYRMSHAEARRIAVGFIAGVAPPKGVRYRKGVKVAADATPAEAASAL